MPKGTPTKVPRSEYLAQMLEDMRAKPPEIRSTPQLYSNLLAQGLTAYAQNKAEKKETAQAQAEQARMGEIMQRLGISPAARMAYELDPSKAADIIAKGSEPYTLSQGQSRYQGDQQIAAAPDYMQTGDQIVRVGGAPPQAQQPPPGPPMQLPPTVDAFGVQQGPDGGAMQPQQPTQPMPPPEAQSIFTRQPTYTEQETARHNPVMEDIAQQGANTAQGQLGVSQGNLAQRRAEHEARMKQGGYGTPGAAYDPSTVQWD